jgi:type I restriction enzyme M protein
LGDLLTPEDKKRLGNNLFGLDIDPMMVKLALANLYLNGLNEPNIFEYDSLTSEDRWHEEFDVILANPPFMTPKGGIKPHNKFSINAKKAEILFVDYCIQHLRGPKKLGIIIPEGILHNNYNSYKEIRKRLIQDNLLFCEVELHHGVFKPYADVKTHILFCDYHVSKKSNSILFVNIKNDGFSITGARKKINDNDIDFAKDLIKCFKENKHINPSAFEGLEYKVIQKKDILNEKVFSLIGRRYLVNDIAKKSNFPSISLKDKIQIFKGKSGAQSTKPGKYKFVVSGEKFKSSEEFHFDFKAVCIPIVSSTGHGHASVRRLHYVEGKFALADIMCCIKVNDENLIHPKFLFIILNSQKDRMIASLMTGTSNVSLNLSDLEHIEIPFPSYEIQLNIVEEYETHSRRIFDLEKEVIERKIIQDSCGLKVWGE